MDILPRQRSLFDETKRCSRCEQQLPLDLFMPRSDRPGLYHSACKPCLADAVRAKYAPHPRPSPPLVGEKVCTHCKRSLPVEQFPFRSDQPGRRRSHCIDCKRAAKREYGEANRDALREAARAYYRADPEAAGTRVRAAIAKNPEKYQAIHSDWKKRNKDAVNASTHKRRARIRHNGGSWTAEDWERLKARYDWRCLMCGKQEMTDGITLCFDHVVPLSLGGLNIISNGQPLCRSCNSLKHRKVKDYRPDFWRLQKVEQQANVAQA